MIPNKTINISLRLMDLEFKKSIPLKTKTQLSFV
jgi:hypothetical protein